MIMLHFILLPPFLSQFKRREYGHSTEGRQGHVYGPGGSPSLREREGVDAQGRLAV